MLKIKAKNVVDKIDCLEEKMVNMDVHFYAKYGFESGNIICENVRGTYNACKAAMFLDPESEVTLTLSELKDINHVVGADNVDQEDLERLLEDMEK